jgi:hypothetical protein
LSSGGCLQHDARHTVQQIQDLKVVELHLPSHAPDWAPSDFHFFCQIKDALGGRHFRSYEAVHDRLAQQPKGVPRNLRLSGTLAEVCTTWWGTALKIDVIALCLFVQNSTFYIFFSRSSFEWLLYKQVAYMQIDTGKKLKFAGLSTLKGARSSCVSS